MSISADNKEFGPRRLLQHTDYYERDDRVDRAGAENGSEAGKIGVTVTE
jgi:hypothetical protein